MRRSARASLGLVGLVGLGALGGAVACGELRSADDAASPAFPAPGTTGDGEESSGNADGGSKGPDASKGSSPDGGGPGAACRPTVLPCLDPSLPEVIEVPTEMTLPEAIDAAKPANVIQVKGGSLGSLWRVPPYVTLRGCAGASIVGSVTFQGSSGIVEGFDVKDAGQIVANVTGSYIVRQNRFLASTSSEARLAARSVDGIVPAEVTLLAEANLFEDRVNGIAGATSYDTGTRHVDLTVRNNVFRRVERPIVLSESGSGHVDAKIEHNTFYDFDTAIGLFFVDRVTKTTANVFQKGATAIGGSPFELEYSFVWDVTTPTSTPPSTGAFAVADPELVDPEGGDLRPGPGSPLVDAVPSGDASPAEDFQGCPRPTSANGAEPRADVGAFENP